MTIEITEDQGIIFTIEEVVDSFSSEMPPEVQAVNLAHFKEKHASMKEGEGWSAPKIRKIFIRRGEGFEVWNSPSAY